jgi:hypothetical protein
MKDDITHYYNKQNKPNCNYNYVFELKAGGELKAEVNWKGGESSQHLGRVQTQI